MAVAARGDRWGLDGLTSKTGKAAWAGDLTPAADEAAEEGLPFKVFGVEGGEDEAEDILRKARTGARHVTVAMGCSKGPGATTAGLV